jgi:rhamnosyltransferase
MTPLLWPHRHHPVPSPLPELTPAAICAVIVTYNPDDFSLQTIRSIVEEAAHIVILDNHSGESSLQKLRPLKCTKVTLVENAENTGIAGGLNLGIQAAAEKGYQWFLLFDQDTKIFPATIPALIDAYADCGSELGPKLGFLGANYHLHLMKQDEIFDGTVPFCQGKRWSTGKLILTSGTLIHWQNFQALGPFREDLFIDHVDHEYQLRAMRRGLVVARTALPLLVHRLGLQHKRRALLAFGQKKMSSYYSPLRRYYQIRNFAALAREYENEFPEVIDFLRRSIKRETFRALKYEGGACKNLISIGLALRDGRRGVTGKYHGRIAL